MSQSSTVVVFSAATLSRTVDQLGALNAEMAELKAKATKLKAKLVQSGESSINGKYYRAVIVKRESVRLDTDKAKALLTPAQVTACSVTSSSTAVSLYDK